MIAFSNNSKSNNQGSEIEILNKVLDSLGLSSDDIYDHKDLDFLQLIEILDYLLNEEGINKCTFSISRTSNNLFNLSFMQEDIYE